MHLIMKRITTTLFFMESVKFLLGIVLLMAFLPLGAQCVDDSNFWTKSWVSCDKANNPIATYGASHWILYEFDEVQYLDSTHIWNANRAGESSWGAKDVMIDYSFDGVQWTNLGQFAFPQANESNNYTGFVGPSFDGAGMRMILITVLSTHGGTNCASLAEVKFGVDPDACYGTIDACGVCDGPGAITWYIDMDGDGQGDEMDSLVDCVQPEGYVANKNDRCDDGPLGWDNVNKFFVNSGCTCCHGGASGLYLDSYIGISAGGMKCQTDLLTGTKLIDIITETGYSGCGQSISGPAMNDRVSQPLNHLELATIQRWIDGGAPELCEDFCDDNCNGTTNVSLRVLLEGCYAGNTQMHASLGDLIPLKSSDVYGAAPYNYEGQEALDAVPVDMVDWVLVEARTGNPDYSNQTRTTTVVETVAGILNKNGKITSIDGSPLRFRELENQDFHHFVIRHRNHLDIMSSLSYKGELTHSLNFTGNPAMSFGSEQLKPMGDGRYAMHAGDYNQDHVIQTTDFDEWQEDPAVLDVYRNVDGNLDGVIQTTDFDTWNLNKAKIGCSELAY